MVDVGIIGLIYDSWMMENGKGAGVSSHLLNGVAVPTGLEKVAASGALDEIGTGKTETPFCSVQEFSREVSKVTKYTYGQKLVGAEGECECSLCGEADYNAALCDINADLNDDNLPQHYCNGGGKCTLSAEAQAAPGRYRCPSTCLDASACELCADSTERSFCKIERTGEKPLGASRALNSITDLYWEFIAGLPAVDKCCLTQNVSDNSNVLYTYVERAGSKQQSEFLQYPTRGEAGIDCGRVPDTDVLKYCGISIPISQLQVDCNLAPAQAPPDQCGEPNSGTGACLGAAPTVECSKILDEGCCNSVLYSCSWDSANSVCAGSTGTVDCNQFNNNPAGCTSFSNPVGTCSWAPS
jgi:hypothetical protein